MISLQTLLLAAAAAAALSSGSVHKPAPEPDLGAIRAATERFKDVKIAEAEGYRAPPGLVCETAGDMGMAPELGGMGVHYFRPDLLGITAPPNPRVNGTGTHTDFNKPAILIYEPDAEGKLELVAVENLVFKKAWHDAGNKERPSLHGIPYEEMADDPATPTDEAHMFEPHYDKHVWLYRDNPNGTYAPFNPTVTCKHGKRSAHAHH